MERGGISARQNQSADPFRDALSRTNQAGGGSERSGELQCRGAGVERTNHFPAQDRSWRRGQELWNSGGAAGRFAEGDFGSGKRYFVTLGEPKRRRRSDQGKKKEIDSDAAAGAKAAVGFVMRRGLRPQTDWLSSAKHAKDAKFKKLLDLSRWATWQS